LLPAFKMPVKVDARGDATRPSGKMDCTVQAGDEFRNGFPDGFLGPATNLSGAQGNCPFSWRTGAAG